jgi:hypothetical protein
MGTTVGRHGHLWVSDGLLAHATGAWVVDTAAPLAAAAAPDEEERLE